MPGPFPLTFLLLLLGLGRNQWSNHPYYMSPEQIQQAFIDWRSDQWALGALIIELFLGIPPYHNHPDPLQAAKD